jgi:hypothetical protein
MKRNLPILSVCALAIVFTIVAISTKNTGPAAVSPSTNRVATDSSVKIIFQPQGQHWTVTSPDGTTFSYKTTNSLPAATPTRNTN